MCKLRNETVDSVCREFIIWFRNTYDIWAKKTNTFCPNLKFLSLLLYVFIRRDLIQISRPLSPPFLCIILLILSHIQRPLHPSSRFSSMSQWRVNNSWSGCLLVEMKSCEKSRIHVLISERPFSPKTRRPRRGGSRCAPPRRVVQAATTTPSWLHYITSAAFTTVTREPFRSPGMEPSTETRQELVTALYSERLESWISSWIMNFHMFIIS